MRLRSSTRERGEGGREGKLNEDTHRHGGCFKKGQPVAKKANKNRMTEEGLEEGGIEST